MSLINNMLLDLEARPASLAPEAAARPIYQDLHAANSAPPSAPRARRSLVLTLLGVTAAALGGWLWPSPTAISYPVVTAPVAPVTALIESLPDAPPTPEITPPPTTAGRVADPAPAVAVEAPQLSVVTEVTPPQRIKTRLVSSPPPTPAPEPVKVAPVTVIKTQRVVSAAEHAQDAHQEGQRRYAEQNYPEAERLWRSALDFDAQQRQSRAQLATLLLAAGRNADAQALLEQGVALVPDHPEFALMLARIQLERGQETEALMMLEQAASHTAGDVDINAFIAALQQRAGQHAQATQRYRQVLVTRPLEGRWWVGLAISLEAQQDWPAARAAYARAIDAQLTPELTRYAGQRLAALRNHP